MRTKSVNNIMWLLRKPSTSILYVDTLICLIKMSLEPDHRQIMRDYYLEFARARRRAGW